jgi:hypothetical protein
MTSKFYLIVNPVLLHPLLAMASIQTVLNGVAWVFAAVGVLGAGAAIIFAGITIATQNHISMIKPALYGAGAAALGFPIALALFNLAGLNVQINPTAVN